MALDNKVGVLCTVKSADEIFVTIVNENDNCDNYLEPFFATVVTRSNIFNASLKQGNFEMLAMWAKDTFNLSHKKITIRLCPTLKGQIGKRFG